MRKSIAALLCLLYLLALTAQAQQLPPGSVIGNFDAVQAPPYPVPTTGGGAVVRATDPIMGNITVDNITAKGADHSFLASAYIHTLSGFLALAGNANTYIRGGTGTVFIADDRGPVLIGSPGAPVTIRGPLSLESTLSVNSGIGTAGGVTAATNISITSQGRGCAQFNVGGSILSTGIDCGVTAVGADLGAGYAYISNGIEATLPYSGITRFEVVQSGGATCNSPQIKIVGGTQSTGNPVLPAGGGTGTLVVTGTAPNQTITGVNVGNPGQFSWPPGVHISGCTGFYKIDAVLNHTIMATVSVSAGVLVVNQNRYNVPGFTYTYPLNTTYNAVCDFFNTATLTWRHDPACVNGTNELMIFIISTGNAPTWPGPSGGGIAASQVWQVTQLPGFTPTAGRTWNSLQQGVGQSGQGQNQACTFGVNAGGGSCSWNGRWFAFGSDDPSNMPWDTRLDGNNIALSRVAKGRRPSPGDFNWSLAWSAQSYNSGDSVGMMQANIFAGTRDPTDGLMAGANNFTGGLPETAGGNINWWDMSPGLVAWNYLDAGAPSLGADTVSVHSRVNFQGNKGGYYIDGARLGMSHLADGNFVGNSTVTGWMTVGKNVRCGSAIFCVDGGGDGNLWVQLPSSFSDGIGFYSVNDPATIYKPMQFAASQFLFSQGIFGIGAVDPGYNVNISGGGSMVKIANVSGGTDPQVSIGFLRNGVAVGAITTTNTGTTYGQTSDERLKKDERPFGRGAEIIDGIQIWDFAWRIDDSRDVGVFAQQAALVFPNAFTPPIGPDGIWYVDYSKFVPVLIADAQTTHARLEALTRRVEALEGVPPGPRPISPPP